MSGDSISSIDVNSSGKIIFTNYHRKVYILASTGEVVSFGTERFGSSKFKDADGIYIDDKDGIYVADDNTIYLFNPSGHLIKKVCTVKNPNYINASGRSMVVLNLHLKLFTVFSN